MFKLIYRLQKNNLLFVECFEHGRFHLTVSVSEFVELPVISFNQILFQFQITSSSIGHLVEQCHVQFFIDVVNSIILLGHIWYRNVFTCRENIFVSTTCKNVDSDEMNLEENKGILDSHSVLSVIIHLGVTMFSRFEVCNFDHFHWTVIENNKITLSNRSNAFPTHFRVRTFNGFII